MQDFFLALFTAYSPYCKGCTGITYSGLPADPNEHYLAANLEYWDIGDRLEVCFNVKTECVVYTIVDTGSALEKSNHFDLLLPSNAEALQWGKRYLYVRKL